MSVLNRMTIAHIHDENKKKSGVQVEVLKPSSKYLSGHIANQLCQLGFDFNQIYLAYRQLKFNSCEEAVQFIMKDSESNKYMHIFEPNKNKSQPASNLDDLCLICHDKFEFHKNLNDENRESIKTTKSMLNYEEIKLLINEEDDDDTICRICCSSRLDNNNKREKLKCGHLFCELCIEKHIKTSIDNGIVLKIKCLSAGCPYRFDPEEVKTRLDKKLFSRFVRFYNRQVRLLEDERKILECPFIDCDQIVYFNERIQYDWNLECDNGHKFCGKCKSLTHHEEICKTNQERLMELMEKGNYYNLKICPQCDSIVEKLENLNEITCMECDFKFCFLCSKEVRDDHYSMYNFLGCPGMREHSNQNHEHKNSKCLNLFWYLISFLLGVIFFACIAMVFFFVGCSYEFIMYYLRHKDDPDESQISEEDSKVENIKKEVNCEEVHAKEISICILLSIIGLALQPFYLAFYILFAMMECYRRFGCWFYYY